MITLPIKVYLKWAGLWTLFVSVVVLFTVIFSFLGTISCAVIAGMAMAASRLWNWHVVGSSLVFPGVVLALAYFSKIDLVSKERLTVAAVCFGAFWGTFLLTFLLMQLERRDGGSPATKTPRSAASVGARDDKQWLAGQREVAADSDTAMNLEGRPAKLSLEELQGRWSCEGDAIDDPSSRKMIEIAGDRLVLSVRKKDGSARVLGEGVVKLETSESRDPLPLPKASKGSGGAPAKG